MDRERANNVNLKRGMFVVLNKAYTEGERESRKKNLFASVFRVVAGLRANPTLVML